MARRRVRELLPEGKIIEEAREALGLTVKAAAALVRPDPITGRGISYGRWSQVVAGYKIENGRIIDIPLRARDFARMADALGIDPTAFNHVNPEITFVMQNTLAAGRPIAHVADALARIRRAFGSDVYHAAIEAEAQFHSDDIEPRGKGWVGEDTRQTASCGSAPGR
jgi:hypothetical protein